MDKAKIAEQYLYFIACDADPFIFDHELNWVQEKQFSLLSRTAAVDFCPILTVQKFICYILQVISGYSILENDLEKILGCGFGMKN